MERLVKNTALYAELRQKGLERAKLFSWERTAELTWQKLQEVAG
jgi:glycosyltransferase involved in cell wall biosynthesis